jgi:lysophospholipase L1-like esterase
MKDLNLNPKKVPLLAGEVVNADQGGVCASMNSIIATLPQTIPNSYVISSSGCTDSRDNLHFNAEGYRELGKRYAARMLSILGYNFTEPE